MNNDISTSWISSHLERHRVSGYYSVQHMFKFMVSEGIKDNCLRVLGFCVLGHVLFGSLDKA